MGVPIVKEFLDFIHDNNLCKTTDNILVTVSGGVDSMVLASLFKEAKYNFSIAHCNFHLRGEESDDDEKFVRAYGESIEGQCFFKSFDTKNYAGENSISIEMAARELRYQWFYQLAEEHNFDRIATAHHLNDSLETAIFNLTKGTGISGLRGIALTNNLVIRPLLFLSKQEILTLARDQNLKWREDSSNKNTDHLRNRIRAGVIPELKKINPALEQTFRQTQQKLRETEALLKNQADQLARNHLRKRGADFFIEMEGLKGLKLTVILEELIKPFGFNYSQAEQVLQSIHLNEPGKLFISDAYRLNIDRTQVIISPLESTASSFLIKKDDTHIGNKWLMLDCFLSADHKILTKGNEVSFDLDKLVFPLRVRKWQEGDGFYPLGMKGKKKLSDFMIDEKIPLNLKERVFVLLSGDEIAWVIGYRMDERFKITGDTREIYNIVMSDND